MRKISVLGLLILLMNNLHAQPVSLHPVNQHYFLFKGKPTVLVASTEHYGSVVNPDFNFVKYLETIRGIGLNHTRMWCGDYIEVIGDFCMGSNTSAPLSGKFLAPWARSNEPGFAAGGNKFDLDKWNPDYFTRLHVFMKKAEEQGIVVEVMLFFVGPNWKLLPMNPANNINNTTNIPGIDYLTLNNGNILDYQKKFCLKIINELNQYDNIIFNIANEPWFNNQEHPGFASPARKETKEWIQQVSEWIVNEEKKLPKQHILSVDYSNEGSKIPETELQTYWKNISVFNHHYDKEAESVKLNYGIKRALSFNETGILPVSTPLYRIQGWQYLMSGGALYNHLDFSFQVGYEDGNGTSEFICNTYKAGTDKNIKYEMASLLRFFNSIDFVNMRPTDQFFTYYWGNQTVCALENPGKEYAAYIHGGSNEGALGIQLLPGSYEMFWITPSKGNIIQRDELKTTPEGTLWFGKYPQYNEDLAILIKNQVPAYDVFPVFTERKFSSYWKPETGWNPFTNDVKPVSDLTPLFHVYTGGINTGENETGKIDLQFKGDKQISVPEGKYCLKFSPKAKVSIAGVTYKDSKTISVREHGSSKYEEYICDFSTYQYCGKFHFKYWLPVGAKYKVMGKVDEVEITGTGKWETVVINLQKELFTHHTLLWLENKNDTPVDIYIDDVFFYKGVLPAENTR